MGWRVGLKRPQLVQLCNAAKYMYIVFQRQKSLIWRQWFVIEPCGS